MVRRSQLRGYVWATILCGLVALALVGCAGEGQSAADSSSQEGQARQAAKPEATLSLVDYPVSLNEDFGSVDFDISIEDFNDMGFAFGDCVDIVFSNGSELKDVPYYSGYYGNVGDVMLVGYPGRSYITVAINYGDTLWDDLGLKDGDTATITLVEPGKYGMAQETLGITYTDEREDYGALSDEGFANFREAVGGTLKPQTVYRSASPIDNERNRAAYVEAAMADAGVAYILNLSDSEDDIAELLAEDAEKGIDATLFVQMHEDDCVAACDLSASYPSEDFAKALAEGLVDMSAHEGPYLVHCLEGKDRTGFVCMLLEALAGASYEEMLDDYMITYENYYGITREGDPERYEIIADMNLNGMLRYLAGVDADADLSALDYEGPARDYLMRGGMTEEQIDALKARIAS